MADEVERKKRKDDETRKEGDKAANQDILAQWKSTKKKDRKKQTQGKSEEDKVVGKELDQDVDSDIEDQDFDPEAWEIVKHDVDKTDGKPKFRAVVGRKVNGDDKWIWGERTDLKGDGVAGIDEYIEKNCMDIPMFKKLLPKKKKAPAAKREVKKTTTRKQCEHEMYLDEITYKPESVSSFCRDGYYLAGLKCGQPGCGVAFMARSGGDSEKSDRKCVVPSSNAPVYCCINIKGRDTRYDEQDACSHAVCNGCWKVGVLGNVNNKAPRGRRLG
jgi:hypothetical protein